MTGGGGQPRRATLGSRRTVASGGAQGLGVRRAAASSCLRGSPRQGRARAEAATDAREAAGLQTRWRAATRAAGGPPSARQPQAEAAAAPRKRRWPPRREWRAAWAAAGRGGLYHGPLLEIDFQERVLYPPPKNFISSCGRQVQLARPSLQMAFYPPLNTFSVVVFPVSMILLRPCCRIARTPLTCIPDMILYWYAAFLSFLFP